MKSVENPKRLLQELGLPFLACYFSGEFPSSWNSFSMVVNRFLLACYFPRESTGNFCILEEEKDRLIAIFYRSSIPQPDHELQTCIQKRPIHSLARYAVDICVLPRSIAAVILPVQVILSRNRWIPSGVYSGMVLQLAVIFTPSSSIR